MSEYHLPINGDDERWNSLDEFTQGYVQALFFTNCGPGDECEEAGFDELADDALASIVADCASFQRSFAGPLAACLARDYGMERAGMDFMYTRAGHGVGYWDRQELDAEGLGDELTKAAKTMRSECYVYRGDDGKVYVG